MSKPSAILKYIDTEEIEQLSEHFHVVNNGSDGDCFYYLRFDT